MCLLNMLNVNIYMVLDGVKYVGIQGQGSVPYVMSYMEVQG